MKMHIKKSRLGAVFKDGKRANTNFLKQFQNFLSNHKNKDFDYLIAPNALQQAEKDISHEKRVFNSMALGSVMSSATVGIAALAGASLSALVVPIGVAAICVGYGYLGHKELDKKEAALAHSEINHYINDRIDRGAPPEELMYAVYEMAGNQQKGTARAIQYRKAADKLLKQYSKDQLRGKPSPKKPDGPTGMGA